jgi:hypothetical protein
MMAGEPTLQWGSEGQAVVDLQARLTALGYATGAIDGRFGPLTDAAVRQFQSDRGPVVDGIVGPRTWAELGGAPLPAESPEPEPGVSGDLPPSHVVFVTEPAVSGLTLTYQAARIDRAPIAAGAHHDSWSIEGEGNPMIAFDTFPAPQADAPGGVYDMSVQLPELAPGAYVVHVGLTATAGSSEIGHATFTTGAVEPGSLPPSHVVFVTEPAVSGLTLSYRAARRDRAAIPAGSHVDSWSIEGEGNPMVAFDTFSVPFTDASDGVYEVSLQLPDLEPGTYIVHVGLTADAGSSEIGHATFSL